MVAAAMEGWASLKGEMRPERLQSLHETALEGLLCALINDADPKRQAQGELLLTNLIAKQLRGWSANRFPVVVRLACAPRSRALIADHCEQALRGDKLRLGTPLAAELSEVRVAPPAYRTPRATTTMRRPHTMRHCGRRALLAPRPRPCSSAVALRRPDPRLRSAAFRCRAQGA